MPETRLPSRWDWFRADLWALVVPGLRCVHRSHRWGLPCLRHFAYSRLCRVHGWCDDGCPSVSKSALPKRTENA
jgi:hypothetical protein